MKKLFYTNPFLQEWEAEIEEIREHEGKYYITLKESAFYPEGGGQPSDRGTIDGIDVIDVVEEEGVVYHILNAAPQNKTVSCRLDFNRRFDHMQQHTGQHLLSSVFYRLYDGETSSFHLGEDYISIDISLGDITQEMLRKVEDEANAYIYKNLEIKTHLTDAEGISKFPLRKLPPAEEEIRIVEIDETDYSPCCGTHVSRTGEIGLIKILKTEKYKGITRVYFKCGMRALSDFRNKNDIMLELSRYFSSPENEIIDRVQGQISEIKNMSKELGEAKERLSHYEALDIINSASTRVISMAFHDKSFGDIQLLGKHILLEGDFLLILSSIPDKRLLLSHKGTFEVNCGKFFKEHLSKYNGKGGGSDKQAQAGFQTVEDLKGFNSFLVEAIN